MKENRLNKLKNEFFKSKTKGGEILLRELFNETGKGQKDLNNIKSKMIDLKSKIAKIENDQSKFS